MVKVFSLCRILAFLFVCCSCKQEERVIERPEFVIRNSNTLEIDKVVLNDSATVIYVDAFYRPGNWIRIDSGTYLRSGDKKWPLVGSKGIKIQDYHWMPDSGKSSFQLIFPPLDRSIKQVDFIESDCKDCFKIYGIQLVKGAKASDFEALVPPEFKQTDLERVSELPEPELKYGPIRLKIHFLGYRKEMGSNSVNLYLNNFLTDEQEEYPFTVNEDGICEISYEQYGVSSAFLSTPWGSVNLIAEPGIESEVYADLGLMTRLRSPYQVTGDKKSVYYKGKYAIVNILGNDYHVEHYFQGHSEEFFQAIPSMNADEYTEYVMNEYYRLAKGIQADSSLTVLEKEWITLQNKAEAMAAIVGVKGRFSIAKQILENTEPDRAKDCQAPVLTDKHYRRLKEFDLNDLRLLYFQTFVYNYQGIYKLRDWKNLLDIKEGMLVDLEKIRGIGEGVMNLQPLTAEQEKALKSIDTPFYLEAFQHMLKVLQKQIEAAQMKKGYQICEVPVAAKEKLFDAIMSRYKGKVVFVDFWATWCGPCRDNIRAMEPLKDMELKNEKLVFVYLTGESSPMANWQKMIPEIKGDHYRLNKEQWDYVCDQFGIEGIPSYVLVDKHGNSKLRNDLREHSKLKKVLLQEISE